MKKIIFSVLVCALSIFYSFSGDEEQWNENTAVYDVLFHLGEPKPQHYRDNISPELIENGRQIAMFGKMKGGKYVSKFYVCSSCHNSVREDPDLTVVDQDARLDYAHSENIPYLQSSTFWAMVNRESWYNDDYVKKYGDLVVKANKSLEESIQLCATVCSQGRRLENEEMDALLAYFWSLQLKLSDLNLNDFERSIIYQAYNDADKGDEVIQLIKSKYLLKSPATFGDIPGDKSKGYELTGRSDKGSVIFNNSCKHCHRANGESDVVFNDSKSTFKWFAKHIEDDSQLSLYNIIRIGTYSESGHKEYMPHYTIEKMSNQQVEDLRTFIEEKIKN